MPESKAFNLLMGRNNYKDGVMMAVSVTPSFDVLEMKEALKISTTQKEMMRNSKTISRTYTPISS